MLELPALCKKRTLYNRFSKISIKDLRKIINTTIAENRNIDYDEAKWQRVVYKIECAIIMERIGELPESEK